MRLLLLIFLCSGIAGIASATSFKFDKTVALNIDTIKSDTSKKAKKSILKAGLNYSNNSVFLGRTDSVATALYGVGVSYSLKNGIFFSGGLSYIPSRQFDKVDGENLEIGYNFEANDISGGATISKYFPSFNSTQIISALDAALGAELSYNVFDIVKASVHGEHTFGNSGSGDFLLGTGINHDFTFEKPFSAHDNLGISPAINTNLGTQNFYTNYITRKKTSAAQRKAAGKGKGTTSTPSTQPTSTTNSSKFQVLDYEFSIPIGYSNKKFGLEFSPTYAIAVHKTDDTGTQIVYVPNSSVFYIQVGLSYTF